MKIRSSVFSFALALWFLAPLVAHAQFTAPSITTAIQGTSMPDKTMQPPVGSEGGAFSNSVDPAEYHVGAGDVFQARFWTSDQAFYPVVSSDELLIVNRVGEFSTHGKTLAQLRDEVYAKAATSFESFVKAHENTGEHPMTLSLYQPRRIYVKVRGGVLSPGGLLLSGSTRADVAVDLANKIPPQQQQVLEPTMALRLESERKQQARVQSLFGQRGTDIASQRYITITHPDGTFEHLDIVRYNATHDPKASPLLREGDVIDVPMRDENAGAIGVYGAVRSPGEFEYVDYDSLSSAVKYSFGPTAQADLEHVELTRGADTRKYDLRAIMSGGVPDVPLMRGDRIVIRAKREAMHASVAVINGEVQQPGAFPIEEGVTKLSDVIREAGGLTAAAYPKAGRVIRHGHYGLTTGGTFEDVYRATRLANLTVEDTASFIRQMSMRQPDLVVDLDRALVQGDKSADVTLADGDEIDIPKRPTTIYLSGFVNHSGYVPYQEGARLEYYIARAGGFAEGAVESRTVIIKAGSNAWLDPDDTKIEPGDEIFVPQTPQIPLDVKRNVITSYSQLALAVLTFALTLYNTFHKQQ